MTWSGIYVQILIDKSERKWGCPYDNEESINISLWCTRNEAASEKWKIGVLRDGVTVSDAPIIIYLLLAVLVAVTITKVSNNDRYNGR